MNNFHPDKTATTPEKIRHIQYRGILDSCNYSCSYCPFSKRPHSPKKEAKDRLCLSRLLEQLKKETERFTFQIVPYGEALIHTYYWEFLAELSRLETVKAVGCQTNASFPAKKMIALFLKTGDISKLRLWCTFHPSMTSVESFCRQISLLKNYGISLCAGAVADPSRKDALSRFKASLPKDIYFWLNQMDGKRQPYSPEDRAFFESIDPFFLLEETPFPSDPSRCQAEFSPDGTLNHIFIKANGDIYACILSKTCLGNLYGQEHISDLLPPGNQKTENLPEKPSKKAFQCPRFCHCFLAYQNLSAAIPELAFFAPYPSFRILNRNLR